MAVRGIRTLSRAHQVSLSCRQQSTDVQAGATIEAARPWEDIPSLPWVPIVGNIALAFKCVSYFLQLHKTSVMNVTFMHQEAAGWKGGILAERP